MMPDITDIYHCERIETMKIEIKEVGKCFYVNGHRFFLKSWSRNGLPIYRSVINAYKRGELITAISVKYSLGPKSIRNLIRATGLPKRKEAWQEAKAKNNGVKRHKISNCPICGARLVDNDKYFCSSNCESIARSIREGGTRQLTELMNA